MFTFLIISDIELIADIISQTLSKMGAPTKEMGGRILVESTDGMEGGWIAFQPITNIQNDYEIDELEEIKNRISSPFFYLIEGKNGKFNFSNLFIQNLNPPGKVLIDNDHGMIAELAEIKKNIESGGDWLHLPS